MLQVGGFLDGSKHDQQWDTLHQLYEQKIDGLLDSDGQTNFRTVVTCYGLTSARLCWIAIGWHGVGCRLWNTGQGLKMDCV